MGSGRAPAKAETVLRRAATALQRSATPWEAQKHKCAVPLLQVAGWSPSFRYQARGFESHEIKFEDFVINISNTYQTT